MSRTYKIFCITHSMILICLMFCNGGTGINPSSESRESLCKGLQCGCRSEPDYKKDCCCTFTGEQDVSHTGDKQKNIFRVFMSSIECMYGKGPLVTITFTSKYILEGPVLPIERIFLCFLPPEIPIYFPEVFISPPKKPPRYFL